MDNQNLFMTRAPLGSLRERDIDLLLCSELHQEGPLRNHLAGLLDIAPETFAGAWVSHVDAMGESDLIVQFSGKDGDKLLLIENKIMAAFQPDQVERYFGRAQEFVKSKQAVLAKTVLAAPQHYMARSGAEKFDHRITYESLCGMLRDSIDGRSRFLAEALDRARDKSGYVAIPDEDVTNMWRAIWRIATQATPALRMPDPGRKPGRSTWPYFRNPEGVENAGKAVTLVYKASTGGSRSSQGAADLQFSSRSAEELESVAHAILENDMVIVPASKSAAIRIIVPEIDFSGDPRNQIDEITEGLAACERLRQFFVSHQSRLLSF